MNMKLSKKITPSVLKNLKESATFEFRAERHPIETLTFVKRNNRDDTYTILADTGGGFPIPLGVCDSENLADLLNDENFLSHTYLDLIDSRAETIEDKRVLLEYNILRGTRIPSPARKPVARKPITRKPAARKPARK